MRSRAAIGSPRTATAVGAFAALVLLALAPTAAAKRQIELGSADPRFRKDPAERRDDYLDRAVAAGVSVIRLNAYWFEVAKTRPSEPRSPADPAYRFDLLDAAVRAATERGLRVFITLQRAPEWAEGEPNEETRGAWKPRVGAFGDYAHAIANRYSGSYPDPGRPGESLPRVRHYQAWNEGNLHSFLAPQIEDGKRFAVDRFRRLVNRAYREIKAVDPANKVIAGGSAPVGPTNPRRTDPISFWRKVFCLSEELQRKRRCPGKLRFDIFDHHPINTRGGPRRIPKGRVVVGNFGELRTILRAAERHGTVRPAGRKRRMWASEMHWETDPPDPVAGKPPELAAAFLQEAIYLLWKQGVSVALNFFLVDPPLEEPGSYANIQGGLYFLAEEPLPKPSLTAFRFPLVTDKVNARGRPARDAKRKGRRGGGARQTIVWGRAPVSGTARISVYRRGAWRRIATKQVSAGSHFRHRLELQRGELVRARIGAESSLVWEHRR